MKHVRLLIPNLFTAGSTLFGRISYAVYDLTNYAMLAEWPLRLTCIDILCGCVLCGGVSQIAYLTRRLLT